MNSVQKKIKMKEMESKELSKSLVGGNMDSLPYYNQSIKSKSRGCRTFPIMVTLMAVGFIVWLAGLTFASQWQISKLESETAALKMDIEMLKLKIAESDRVNDVKIFQDPGYADPLDRGSTSKEDDEVEFAGDVDEEPLKKIYGTVLRFPGVFQIEQGRDDSEDDNDHYDDEEDDDDVYTGSGDWSYLDYDKNRPADDEDETSNAGNHLPDDEDSDFLGKVMEGRSEEDLERTNDSSIHKIIKILREDSQGIVEDRSKRQADTSKDRLKIHAKSFKESHVTTKPEQKSEKNLSIYEKVAASKVSSGNRQKRHQYSFDTTKSAESIADEAGLAGILPRSNDLTDDDAAVPPSMPSPSDSLARRKFSKKTVAAPSMLRASRQSENYDYEEEFTTTTGAPPRRRKHRQRGGAMAAAGRGGLVAAHFAADTSDLEEGKHQNYHGNGLLSLPHEATHASWREAAWLPALGADRHFQLDADSGVIHVKVDGIYFVYAQIYFQDQRDTNSFRVLRNDVEPILHCTTTSMSAVHAIKANTCYTAAAAALRAGDRLAVRNVGGERYSIMTPDKSFIGLIKLGDHGAV